MTSARWTPQQLADYRRKQSARKPDTSSLPTGEPPAEPRQVPKRKGPNVTEIAYALILRCEMQEGKWDHVFDHESIKVKVGKHRCWYTPDFATIKDCKLTFHEVKGGLIRDDARVKYQSAVRQYPQFGWRWAQRINGEWKVTDE